MDCPDVNVLIYAHRRESPEHSEYADWLTRLVSGPSPFALSEPVLSGFLRIVTNPRVFRDPTPLDTAIDFVQSLLVHPACRQLRPGARHFGIFLQLCMAAEARGKLVADAYHAALAVEYGVEWVTNDGDFSRFPNLVWRHPLSTNT